MLPKKERILKSREIKAVIHRGKLQHSSPLLRIFSDGGDGLMARFTVICSKRLGNAVVRNRIRRRIIAQIAIIRRKISKMADFIVIPRVSSIATVEPDLLRQELMMAIK